MAQNFAQVDSCLVEHHHFRALSERAKGICQFLRITPRNNAVGCYYYPVSQIADDYDIPLEGASEALAELAERDFARYCPVTRWVWIPKHLDRFPVKGRNSGKHALSVLDTVPRDFSFGPELVAVFEANHDWGGDAEAAELDRVWEGIRRGLGGAFEGGSSRARPDPYPDSDPDPDSDPSTGVEGSCGESPSDSPPVLSIPLVKRDGEFPVHVADIREWEDSFPGVDVLAGLKHIRQWAIDNPPKRKTKRGIRGCITRWLAKAQDSGQYPRTRGSRAAPETGNDAAARAWLEQSGG